MEILPLPEVRARRLRALATAILRPFDRSAALVFFGAVGLTLILIAETLAAAAVLADPEVEALDYVDLQSPGHPALGGEGHLLPPLP